jgi:hypothetical protein
MGLEEGFRGAVLRELSFLTDDYGFRVTRESERCVRFESQAAVVVATFDPRGEIELRVAQLGQERGIGTLTLAGSVGRASPPRVVQLLAERLRGCQDALSGNEGYFKSLREEQQRDSEELTAYYAGRGPPPARGRLPD